MTLNLQRLAGWSLIAGTIVATAGRAAPSLITLLTEVVRRLD